MDDGFSLWFVLGLLALAFAWIMVRVDPSEDLRKLGELRGPSRGEFAVGLGCGVLVVGFPLLFGLYWLTGWSKPWTAAVFLVVFLASAEKTIRGYRRDR